MEHHERADELEQEAAHAGEASERLEQEVEDARSDWDAKKSDQSVPGAVESEAAGPHNLEGEDPATGETKADERQEEVEAAAQADAEREDEEE
jgi:hypothetical protein